VDNPLFNIGIIELGQQMSIDAGASLNPLLEVTPLKFSLDLGFSQFALGWEGNQVEVGFSTPSTEYQVEGSDATVSYQQSATVAMTYDWWNTTIRGEYNTIDLSVSSSDDQPGFEGNVSQGIYFEEKPVQAALAVVVIGVLVAVAAVETAALAAIGEAFRQLWPHPLTP
jgi:hypothetical protein